MAGHEDHRFVRGRFRQRGGVDSVDFKKISGGLHCGPFVAVKVRLVLGDMEGVGSGNFVEVAVSIEIHV